MKNNHRKRKIIIRKGEIKIKMFKYFEIPFTEYKGIVGKVYRPNDIVKEVNAYADEKNLEIVSISTYENKGIYVSFKQKCVN